MKRRSALALLAGAAMAPPLAAVAAAEPPNVLRLGVLCRQPPGPVFEHSYSKCSHSAGRRAATCGSIMCCSATPRPTALLPWQRSSSIAEST